MKILLFANTSWYLFNFRLALATRLREEGHEVLLVSPPDAYGSRLREAGFTWVIAPLERRSLNPIRELRFVLWLRRLLLREQVDVVHGFTIKCAVYGALAARLTRRTARVSSIAGMGYVFTSNDGFARALRPFVRIAMRMAFGGRSSYVITQNPDDAALLIRCSVISATYVRLIKGSGVDCDNYERTPIRTVAPLKVLLAARLLRDKGVVEFVGAASILRKRGISVEFVIAGDLDEGNPASIPHEMIQEWTKSGLVVWLGHVEDMRALLNSVDIFALPSYGEGLPKGLVEAAACGLPLITTDAPGCREVVTHGIDGLVVPTRDALALAEAIATLARRTDLRESLGAAARLKARTQFDQKTVLAETLQVYQEALSSATS